jgi:hypothetical protein
LPTHEAGTRGGSGSGGGGSGSGQVVRSRTGRISLVVRPRRVRSGHRVRVRFLARTFAAGLRRPVSGAVIRFAGHRLRTDRHGRASIRIRLRHASRATASKPGLLPAAARIRLR